MNKNLTPTANADMIKTPELLEATVQSLHGYPFRVDRTPFLSLSFLCKGSFMGSVGVNDWQGMVMKPDGMPEVKATVACIGYYIFRVETPVRDLSLSKKGFSLADVMNVTSSYGYHEGQFILGIAHDVSLISENEFSISFCVLLNTPSSIRVRSLFAFALAVTPRLNIGGVHSDNLPKIGQFCVELACQFPLDIADFDGVPITSDFSKESAECRLARNPVRRFNPTSVSYERIIVQSTDKVTDGGQSQHVEGDVAMPENFRTVRWSSYSPWVTSESAEEIIIGNCLEDSFEFPNYWRNLFVAKKDTSIRICHWEAQPFSVDRGCKC